MKFTTVYGTQVLVSSPIYYKVVRYFEEKSMKEGKDSVSNSDGNVRKKDDEHVVFLNKQYISHTNQN